jgi:hypothetical protein
MATSALELGYQYFRPVRTSSLGHASGCRSAALAERRAQFITLMRSSGESASQGSIIGFIEQAVERSLSEMPSESSIARAASPLIVTRLGADLLASCHASCDRAFAIERNAFLTLGVLVFRRPTRTMLSQTPAIVVHFHDALCRLLSSAKLASLPISNIIDLWGSQFISGPTA